MMTTKENAVSKDVSTRFLRAKEEWLCRLARNRSKPPTVMDQAVIVAKHFNREEFAKTGKLVAFPGVRLLAALTGLANSTIVRNNRWMEEHRFLRVKRGKAGNKRLANQYTAEQGGSAATEQGGSAATRTEPMREPMTEPRTLCKNIDTIGIVSELEEVSTGKKDEGDFRDSKDNPSLDSIESPSSLEAQCYQLAREFFGESGAGVVGRALKIDIWPAAQVLEKLDEVKADGGDVRDLAYALWQPD